MLFRTLPTATAVLALMLAGTGAQADVSADQVWQAWLKQYESLGYTVTGADPVRSGDTLTATELKLNSTVEGTTMELSIPELVMRETGSGTVEVSFPESMTGNALTEIAGEGSLKMDIALRQSGMIVTVSGTPEVMNHAIVAPEVTIEMDQSALEGAAPVPVKLWISMTGGAGVYEVSDDNGTHATKAETTLDALRMTTSGADPETGATFAMEVDVANLNLATTARLPEGTTTADMAAALAAGAQITLNAGFGESTGTMTTDSPDGPVALTSAAQSGTIRLEMSEQTLHYAGKNDGVRIDANIATLPMPVTATMGTTEFEFALPAGPADTAQPLIGKIALQDLEVSDSLWALFDPMQQIPRTPATLIVDLSGTAQASMSLFSPQAAELPMPPIQVDTLNVNALRLDLAGAELTGTGALSFDNSMGMPMPVGQIDLRLAGANGLMNTLTAMGFLPEDQAMFARMMMGLYAVPVGEDELTSTIEFREGGEVLANGQRIQ